MAIFFPLSLSFLPFYILKKPEPFSLWLLGIISQRREKVCAIFVCLYSCWGSLHCSCCTLTCYECSKCLYCRDTYFDLCFIYFLYDPKFSLIQIAETHILICVLFTFCMTLNFHWSNKVVWIVYHLYNVCLFCMQAWHFRNFQVRPILWSLCHYIFRAYTTKNLKETCCTCIQQRPVHRCQNVH